MIDASGGILNRLAGLETEYAVRAPGEPAGPVISRVLATLSHITPTVSSTTLMWSNRMFCANGGAFYHEVQSAREEAGLLEGATPECRGPLELVTFQRAQERLLVESIRRFGGRYGLLKNSRDAFGNTYGVQENYDALVARGWRLWVYRAGLVALTPLFAAGWVATWCLVIVIVLVAFAYAVAEAVLTLLGGPSVETTRLVGWVSRRAAVVDRLLWRFVFGVPLFGLLALLRFAAFTEFQRGATAYLVTRMVFTGTGTIEADGAFHVSERKSAILGRTPWRLGSDGVYVYWFSNFAKRAIAPSFLQFRHFGSLWATRQRLQIGLSDANACEEAEYLKVGTAMLVLDMAEAGWLDGAPRLDDMMEALEIVGSDTTLHARVETTLGAQTALEVQRWYCDRAKAFVEAAATVPLEAWDIVKRWAAVLDALEHDRMLLVGRVDWVTKQYLLDTTADDASDGARKKLDLRYHELDTGYLAQMAQEGFIERVTTEEAVAAATQSPPQDTPATARSRWVRDVAQGDVDAKVDWREVRVRRGDRLRRQVIRLDDYRRR